MLNDKSRMKSGDMEAELSAKVDGMLDEFMAKVDSMTEERHLQKGIARSQLPVSMVAILDRDSLTILGQFRLENRTASYFCRPDIALNAQQAAQSAQWEFGFDDPFIISPDRVGCCRWSPAPESPRGPGPRSGIIISRSSYHIQLMGNIINLSPAASLRPLALFLRACG